MYRLCILFILIFSFPLYAQNIASFKKKGAKNAQNIALKEVQLAYQVISQSSLNTPSPNKFVKDYVRYRIAVEEAYNDKSLVKSSSIRNMMVDNGLQESFDQLLYKIYAEKKMQPRLVKINEETRTLSKAKLQTFYAKNPYYNLQYIVVSLPESASSKQINSVKNRAQKVYTSVVKSKKSFDKLIVLHSDNPSAGRGLVYHSRSSLYPLLYQALQTLKPGKISKPIQTPNGFYILKLNQVVAFDKADKENIKQQYFSQKRTEALNSYFNQVQSKYDVSINRKAIQSL